MLGMRLCVLHNLYFYNHLMEEIRDAIDAGRYKEYKEETLRGFECWKINLCIIAEDYKELIKK